MGYGYVEIWLGVDDVVDRHGTSARCDVDADTNGDSYQGIGAGRPGVTEASARLDLTSLIGARTGWSRRSLRVVRSSNADPAKASGSDRQRGSRADRVARGKATRTAVPLHTHAEFAPGASRDPVGLLLRQATDGAPELVPIRHGRMLSSPFAFFRGAALPMAADLATTPTSDLTVQLCGDAHLANFGAFASPERRLVFDINNFDETLPGPFEWDVKRLAASLSVAGRQNGFDIPARRRVVRAMAERYRTAMREFAEQQQLDVWYARLDVDQAIADLRSQLKSNQFKSIESMAIAARTRTSMQALNKLTTTVDGRVRIISRPPTTRADRGALQRRRGRCPSIS